MIKLTQYAAKGGCACKIGPHILAGVLESLPTGIKDPRLLVNMEGSDDAGVFKINENTALVQTLDFFTPPVDDPYLFGRIAATNSLSDVYAMGGMPITAMNIVAFPVPLVEAGALGDVLRGAQDTLQEAGVALVGGHSVEDEVPKFGLSITGTVHPDEFWRNSGARLGDVLILTKPIGTGLMTTALKGDLFPEGVAEAIQSMTTLNKRACEIGRKFMIHACTDITGFSLLGHAREMALGSQVSLEIHVQDLPLFTDVKEAAQMGLIPAATYGNRKAIDGIHFNEALEAGWEDICFDPQTSGGLLMTISENKARTFVEALKREGVQGASIIGRVIEKGEYDVYVTE